MPRLRALRPLCGDYGVVHQGQVFDTDEAHAIQLEKRGLVERMDLATKRISASPENKAIRVEGARIDSRLIPPTVGYAGKGGRA